jgi:hypothetical protein
MTGSDCSWRLDDSSFQERLKLWRNLEDPDAEVLAMVEEWIPTRKLNPFQGARIEREEDDLWFAHIPGSMRGGSVVVCSFRVSRDEKLVRCDLFGTLSWPI